MKKTILSLMLAVGQMFAGGFWLQLGNPKPARLPGWAPW
jgi:hypothetical protein